MNIDEIELKIQKGESLESGDLEKLWNYKTSQKNIQNPCLVRNNTIKQKEYLNQK